MNNKKSREIRKQARKQTADLVKAGVQDAIWKASSARDKAILIAIIGWVCVIGLVIWHIVR